jgi:hypothetical protein
MTAEIDQSNSPACRDDRLHARAWLPALDQGTRDTGLFAQIIEAFLPFLAPMICDADTSDSWRYVGGLQRTEPATAELHKLSFASYPYDRTDIVVVRVRLLAALETPTYYVAVGRRDVTQGR